MISQYFVVITIHVLINLHMGHLSLSLSANGPVYSLLSLLSLSPLNNAITIHSKIGEKVHKNPHYLFYIPLYIVPILLTTNSFLSSHFLYTVTLFYNKTNSTSKFASMPVEGGLDHCLFWLGPCCWSQPGFQPPRTWPVGSIPCGTP